MWYTFMATAISPLSKSLIDKIHVYDYKLPCIRILRIKKCFKDALSWTVLCIPISYGSHKVVSSIPTMVRHISQLAWCGYKLKVIAQTSFSPE